MKKVAVLLTIMILAVLGASGVAAEEEDPIQNAIDACEPEIKAYCSQVTLGEGRLLACFYAHEDKLSGRCSWALYEGAVALEEIAAAISHVATQCMDDMVKHCAAVEMGEGRVASCLLEHKAEVTKGCKQAIDDVGLEMVD